MNVHPIDEDSQEIARITDRHRKILQLKAQRQQTSPTGYGTAASIISAITLAAWGVILGDAWLGSPHPVTRASQAVIAAAIVLGIAAVGAACTWMVVRDRRQGAAEQDTLREYETEQQAKRDAAQVEKVTQAVLAALKEEQRAERVRRWDDFLAAEGTTGAGSRTDQPSSERTQVIDFNKPRRGNARTS